jgi:hypothetical protein
MRLSKREGARKARWESRGEGRGGGQIKTIDITSEQEIVINYKHNRE